MPAIAHQNKILGNTSGGGSTILVTTSESSLYGQTVSLTDGTTTLNTTFNNSGEATFSGVTMTGTLTVSASYGGQTAQRTISVPYFGNYSTSLSFFTATITVTFDASKGATCTLDGVTASTSPYAFTVSSAGTYTASSTLDGVTKQGTAKTITTDGQTETDTIEFGTINVTYDNDFRGASITCTQGGTTITKTAPSGGNTMAFYPPTTGNWVISGTVGGSPYSTSVTVSSLSTAVPANLETIPDGSTKTPTDDVSIWLACAGIKDKSYTTLSQVIGDSETFNALLGDSNACAYMARSTTWTTDICADQYAMNLLGQYDTACDALLSDATWASAICNSTYFESVLNVKVPAMMSNTTPSGICGAEAGNASAYIAFDDPSFSKSITYQQNTTKSWNPYAGSTNNAILWYDFGAPQVIKCCEFRGEQYSTTGYTIKDYDILYSDDGSTWTVLTSGTNSYIGSNPIKVDLLSNDTAHRYWGFRPKNAISSAVYVWVLNLQFYGRTSSSEKVHGANGESAYILDGGSPVTITDPSTLDAGTYTVYSTVAKNPSDLSADYSKTIRICPNTKEIVVRPDNSLYWYGYVGPVVADASFITGVTPGTSTFDTNKMTTGANYSGIRSNDKLTGTKVYILSKCSGTAYMLFGTKAMMNMQSGDGVVDWNTTLDRTNAIVLNDITKPFTNYYLAYVTASISELYAMWYE